MILGSKSGFWGVNNHELATNLERQNGAKCRFFLKKGQARRHERLEIAAIYLLYYLFFR